MINQLFPFLALLVSAFALFLLSHSPYRYFRVILSCGCLLFAFLIYVFCFGIEFGVTYGFVALYGAALFMVLRNKTNKNKKISRNKSSKKKRVNTQEKNTLWWYKLLRFICAGPLSCLAAAVLCVGFCRLMPIATLEQLVLAAFLYPLFWVGLAFFCCRFQRKKVIEPALEAIA